jgi:DNA-binding transcriptional LysR family regulator
MTVGEAFATYADAVLAGLVDAVRAVEDVATAQTGTLAFGLFALPVAYRIDDLVAGFAQTYPDLTLRLVGQNSSDAANSVRRGELEAALVALPIDADRLDVRPLLRDEVVYVSADRRRTRRPVTIEELADRPIVFFDVGSGDSDPTRRQLVERAQEMGLVLTPRFEVETLVLPSVWSRRASVTPTFRVRTPERGASRPDCRRRRSIRRCSTSSRWSRVRARSSHEPCGCS